MDEDVRKGDGGRGQAYHGVKSKRGSAQELSSTVGEKENQYLI